ncbi:MAG: TolC family protein [Bacteroidetes bacterium]|nr:TolC family protein [Bacteroidota bacterium]MDA1121594.1 TolC family protein [Bacteroidota bacterium]
MNPLFRTGFLLLCLTIAITNSSAQEVLKFSLKEAVAYALENNVMVKNAKLDHQASDNEVGEYLAIGLPQVNASVGLNDNFIIQKSIVDVSRFPGSTAPPGTKQVIEFSTQYTGFMDVTLEQLIFDASYFIGLKAARTLKGLTYKDWKLSEIETTEAVTKAYYTALINQERLKLFERQLGTLDTLLQETITMNQNGFAERIDVSRIKVQYNNVNVEKNRFERIAALSVDLLKFQIGLPIRQFIELTENIQSITLEASQNDLVNFDYSNRMEYSQLETNQTLQLINVQNLKSGYYPDLKAFASLGANSGGFMFRDVRQFDFGGTNRNWFESASLGVTLNIPIFDSFQKRNQIQKVKLRLEQIDNQFDFLQNNIDLQILQANNDLQSATENLNAQEENLQLSREIYDVSIIKYQEGVGSNIEVINATTTYKESEINYYNALYDALIAQVDLQKALGTLTN